MDASDELVGVSFFCPLPLPKVADVKINWEKLLKQKPTVVFMLSSQKTENGIKILEKLKIKYGIYSFDSLRSIPFCVMDMAKIIGKGELGKKFFNDFMLSIKNLPKVKEKKAVYVLWWEPLIVSTSSSFICETMSLMGFDIYPKDENIDFKKYNLENLLKLKPDIIFYSEDAGPIPKVIKNNFQIYPLPSSINRPNLSFIKYFYNFKNESIFN